MRFPSFVVFTATCLLVAPAALAAQSGLVGTWSRDSARSDSPHDALRTVVQGSAAAGRERVPFTVTRAGGEPRTTPQPPREPPPAGSSPAFNPSERAVDRAVVASVLNHATVRFESTPEGWIVSVDDAASFPLEPGSQTVSRWGIDDLQLTVKLSADAVELDTRGPEGLRIRERYALNRSGELEARITSERRGLRSPVRVKYLYDRRDDG